MSVEIELKFVVSPTVITTVSERFASCANQHAAPQKLTNIYFETANNDLRNHDMALRIRGYNDHYEMTIKTAGSVVAGVHQRPEYNVAISKPELDLHQFPAEIWPENCEPASLQQALQPLFRTDFSRETWLVTCGNSSVEIALDQGEICAGDLTETICELELELKSGEIQDLLTLAAQLAAQGGLRQGSLSKAARGYHLAQGNQPRPLQALNVMKTPSKATVEQGMVTAFESALAHWQYHEELWLSGSPPARRSILDAIALLRQTLVTFGGLVPRKASHDLRAHLTALEPQLMEQTVDPLHLCYSAEYQQCKLAITAWLITAAWRPFVDSQSQVKLSGSFKRFSDIMLGRCAAELKQAFGHAMSHAEYQEQLPRLTRQILALYLLAGAYPNRESKPYIESWCALQLSIGEHRQDRYDIDRKHALGHTPFWLNSAAR